MKSIFHSTELLNKANDWRWNLDVGKHSLEGLAHAMVRRVMADDKQRESVITLGRGSHYQPPVSESIIASDFVRQMCSRFHVDAAELEQKKFKWYVDITPDLVNPAPASAAFTQAVARKISVSVDSLNNLKVIQDTWNLDKKFVRGVGVFVSIAFGAGAGWFTAWHMLPLGLGACAGATTGLGMGKFFQLGNAFFSLEANAHRAVRPTVEHWIETNNQLGMPQLIVMDRFHNLDRTQFERGSREDKEKSERLRELSKWNVPRICVTSDNDGFAEDAANIVLQTTAGRMPEYLTGFSVMARSSHRDLRGSLLRMTALEQFTYAMDDDRSDKDDYQDGAKAPSGGWRPKLALQASPAL